MSPLHRRRLFVVLFAGYLLVWFKLLFFKIRLVYSTIDIAGNEATTFQQLLAGSNFVPFYKIWYYLSGQEPYLVGLLNLAGNVLLFVPMGFFLAYFFPGLRQAGRMWGAVSGLALCVECLQLLTATGEFDLDDILLNAIGAVAGYGCYWLCKSMRQRLTFRKSQ